MEVGRSLKPTALHRGHPWRCMPVSTAATCSLGLPVHRLRSGRSLDGQERWKSRRGILCASATESTEEMSLGDLQILLEDAVRQEDYATAARLRDELARRSEDDRAGVEDANRRFYEAFRNADLKAMGDIWGQGQHVQCIHPAAGCIAGRENVMESWRLILRGRGMSIEVQDVRVYASDALAYVTCVEVMESGDARGRSAATNVFEKQKGRWVMVHHHGSPAPVFA